MTNPFTGIVAGEGQEAKGERFEVRDRRGGGWYWLHNDLIKRAGPHIGPIGVAVYNVLAMYASEEEQSCYPSLNKIARFLGVSRNQVRRAIDKLKRHRLVEVIPPEDPARTHAHNVYVLTAPDTWELPQGNSHAQLRGERKAPSQEGKTALENGTSAQPRGAVSSGENSIPKTRLGSELQGGNSLCHSDSNGKNGEPGSNTDAAKMQVGTKGTGLCQAGNADGNGENGGANFGKAATNKNNKNHLIRPIKKESSSKHEPAPPASDDDGAIRLMKKLGVSDPQGIQLRALSEGWSKAELAELARRLLHADGVSSPAGLFVKLISQGPREALAIAKRYERDTEEKTERERLIQQYLGYVRLYQCKGIPEEDKEEAKQQGLKLRRKLEALGVNVEEVKSEAMVR